MAFQIKETDELNTLRELILLIKIDLAGEKLLERYLFLSGAQMAANIVAPLV